MLNIFNTINFREKVKIDVNETGKRLINIRRMRKNWNGQNGYIM
ncbi:hypothetical protein [Spiroplasma citri]|nr:hypothetical protein [Spiroplasma citri]